YKEESGIGNHDISRVQTTASATPYSVTYDGNAHTATYSITGVNAESGATVGTIDVTATTHTNAGTYNGDAWTFTGAANYNDASEIGRESSRETTHTVGVTQYSETK